ncbi:LacI-type transcriptional regulator [Operophtera brumata]|uniref:LacI-type transcriptional regulator n=1 Tax=Operophtera brumata TaxID=104452 RepID=A0A0L7LRT3_OPEBR|nr:LacI-type transcriptional regulator [Operophtera brumata]
MQGPYSRLLPLSIPDHMLGLCLSCKGVTVSVKMGPIIEVGHDIKQFDGFFSGNALLTFGFDGNVLLRQPDAPEHYDLKLCVSHRYEHGVLAAVIDAACSCVAHLAGNHTCALAALRQEGAQRARPPLDTALLAESGNTITIMHTDDSTYS